MRNPLRIQKRLHDAPGGSAVTVRIHCFRHRMICRLIGQQPVCRLINLLLSGAHQFYRPRLYRFGTLCRIAKDKDGFPQARRFLLYAA